jgi:hypothetical protein
LFNQLSWFNWGMHVTMFLTSKCLATTLYGVIIRNYNSWICSLVHPLLEQVLTFVFPWLLLHVINANKGILYMPSKILSHGLVAEILEINVSLPEDRSPGLSSLTLEASSCACMQVSGTIQFAGLIVIFQTRLISFISCMDVIGNKYYYKCVYIYIFEFKTNTLMLLMCNKKLMATQTGFRGVFI